MDWKGAFQAPWKETTVDGKAEHNAMTTPHAGLESEPDCQYTAFGVDGTVVCIYACVDMCVCVYTYIYTHTHLYIKLGLSGKGVKEYLRTALGPCHLLTLQCAALHIGLHMESKIKYKSLFLTLLGSLSFRGAVRKELDLQLACLLALCSRGIKTLLLTMALK